MLRFIVAMGLALAASVGSAQRTIELVENGIEAALGDVTLPGSLAGTVIVQSCETCEIRSLRVSAETRFFIGESNLPLAEFTSEVDRIRDTAGSDGTMVGIFYSRESGRVTRIRVSAD